MTRRLRTHWDDILPGKVQPWSMTGGWDRDLDLDIRELKKANVGHVISLVTKDEMEELRVKHLGKRLQSNRIQWYHAPTPDEEVPDKLWFIRSLSISNKLCQIFTKANALWSTVKAHKSCWDFCLYRGMVTVRI